MSVPVYHRDFGKEVRFSATRSSGSGGQNVNKVSSKIELRFSVSKSIVLTEEEKSLILIKLASRINSEGELIITSQTERSQYRNRQVAIERFFNLLASALKEEKPRLKTKPTKASKIKRMTDKLKISKKKQLRKSDSNE